MQGDCVRAGDIVTMRDGRWRVVSAVPHGATTVIDALGCGATNRANRATFLLPFEPFARVDMPRPVVVSRRRWRRAARLILSEAAPAWWSLKCATDAVFDVLPYQLAPALALTRGDAARFLLADAVGLGKTVQAALMVAETIERWPDARAIVICPAGLREQWHDELSRRFRVNAQIVDAASLAHLASGLPPGINPWSLHGVVITSIDYVKRPEVARSLEALVWDIAIFDEAHNLAGRSDRATAANLIARRARHVVLLTATPHSGDPGAFERVCAIGQLAGEPLLVFRRTRSTVGLTTRRRIRFLRVRPTTDERQLHEALATYVRQVWNRRDQQGGARLAMMVLMRRASSSPAALARSIERRLAHLDCDPAVAALQPGLLPFDTGDEEPDAVLAAPGLPDLNTERSTLRQMLDQARRASAAESTMQAVRRFLCRTSEPAIVFTEYRDTLEDLAQIFAGDGTLALHGGLTPRERREVVKAFTSGRSRLLLSTDAGSEGLNLQHRCRIVINIELPWMPRRLEQRAGRVDRIGQKRQVHVVNLVAAGTTEETVLTRLAVRHLRVRDALEQLSLPSDEEIASALVNGGTEVSRENPPSLPDGVVAAAPTADATREAMRIIAARRLRGRGADTGETTMLARVRASQRHAGRQCIWLLSSACAASVAVNLWDARLACRAVPTGVIDRSRSGIRQLLDPRLVLASAPVINHVDQLESEMRCTLAAACQRWRAREEAIVRHLRDQHARLSLALVQPGLFDHRVERRAEAHNEALNVASARCEERLLVLHDLAHVPLETPSCLFGLLLE